MPGERVLVLEDNPELEQRLCDFLGRLGFDPTPLMELHECVEAVSNADAAVVLLDVDPAVEEGAKVGAEIKRRFPGVYMVLTASAERLGKLKELAGTQGGAADCYLAKPFALPILKKILASRPARDASAPSPLVSPAVVPTPPDVAAATPTPTRIAVPDVAAIAAGPMEVLDLAALTVGEAPSEAPPPEGPLAEEIMRRARERGSGCLEVRSAAHVTRIHFVDGAIARADGGSVETTLGRVLLSRGSITEQAYREVLARLATDKDSQQLIGEALMKAGHLSASKLVDALNVQVEEKVLEAMGYRHPELAWSQETGAALPSPGAPSVRKACEHLVMKGIMRHAELDALIEHYKPMKDSFPLLLREEPFARARLSSRLEPILAKLDGQGTIEELAESGILPPADFLKLLRGLSVIGSVQLLDARGGVAGAASPAVASGEHAVLDPEVEALRERVLRTYLAVSGKGPFEVLGLDPGRASLSDADIDAAAAARLLAIDAEKVARLSDSELSDKAAQVVRAVEEARGALADPVERDRLRALWGESTPRGGGTRSALSAEYHLREGRERMERGDVEGALRELEEAHALDPQEPEYAAALARALLARAREDGASEELSRAKSLVGKALDANPRFAAGLLTMAEIHALEGKEALAEKYYRYTLRVDPENAAALRAIQEVEERERGRAAAAPRSVVLAADLLFSGPSARLDEEPRAELVKIQREVFRAATQRHFGPMLRSAGLKELSDYALVERGEQTLYCIPYDDRLLKDRKALVWRILSFPDLLREDVTTKIDLHLINAASSLDLGKAAPQPRLAIAVGEVAMAGGVRGPAVAAALRSLALETDRFTIDHASACELAGSQEKTQLLQSFAEYNYRLAVIPETEAGSAVYVARYQESAEGAAEKARAAAAAPPPPRKPKAFVRPSRRIQRPVSPDELGVLADMRQEVQGIFERDLTTKFNRLKAEEDRKRKKSIWQAVIIGEDDSKVDVERYQIRTHLFAPLLGGAYVFMGMQDFRCWFAYMEEIGKSYIDALAAERDSFLEAGKQIYAGLSVDRTFHDFEGLSDARLLAVSEALSLFPLCIDPEERYEEITLAEFARIAARRYEGLVGTVGKGAKVLPLIHDIYRRAIDTPDDSVEPVNIWQWAVLLSLVGVTVELQEGEIRDARDTYGEGSRRFRAEVEKARKTYGYHLTILKSGLDRYQRIRQILLLKSPLSPLGDDRSIFEKGYQLPLFRFVK